MSPLALRLLQALSLRKWESCCAGFTEPEGVTEVDLSNAPPLSGLQAALRPFLALFERAAGDPFYAVISYRNYKPVYE
jgi:hypothetical protein